MDNEKEQIINYRVNKDATSIHMQPEKLSNSSRKPRPTLVV